MIVASSKMHRLETKPSCPNVQRMGFQRVVFPQIKPAKTNLSLFGRFLLWERYHTGNV